MTQEVRAWLALKRDELKGEVHALTGQLIAIEGLIAAFDAEHTSQVTPPVIGIPVKRRPGGPPIGETRLALRAALKAGGSKGMTNRALREECARRGFHMESNWIAAILQAEAKTGHASYDRSSHRYRYVNGA